MRRSLLPLVLLLVSGACDRPAGKAVLPELPNLDEPTLKAKSHAFLDAFDRTDAEAFAATAGASFTKFERGYIKDEALMFKEMKAEADRHPASPTRTWSEEHVYVGKGTATFIGEAVEHFPAHDDHPASDFDGWNTLVWVREGSEWKVAHWQCAKAGADADREMWNETYRATGGFNPEPNKFLMDTVKGRPPGTALDVAMGQGRNAIYLASQGWMVTGVDLSDEGIRIARETAANQRLNLEAIVADVDKWDFGTARWDLVAMIYAGADLLTVEKVKASLKQGGVFVVEVFHSDGTAGTRSGGFETGQLAALFKDGFKVLHDEVVEDRSDWGGPSKVKVVRFAAQKM